MVMSVAGLGPENDCADEGSKRIVNGRSVLSSERATDFTNRNYLIVNKSMFLEYVDSWQ
jgi:hypothetical protein